jgi:hypothetical protein
MEASERNSHTSSRIELATSAAREVPQHLKDAFVGEFALAAIWTAIYIKAGRSWAGLANLSMKYHWAGGKSFQDLFAPELQAHSLVIAWLLPVVLIFIAWSWNWPIGGGALIMGSSSYVFLTLDWLGLIPILGMSYFMWSITGRTNFPALMNVLFFSVLMPAFIISLTSVF